MEISIILEAALVLVVMCLILRRHGRYLYLTFKIPGPSLWDFVTVHAKELLSDNMVYHVRDISAAYKHRPWGMWTFRGFVVVVSDCDSVSEAYKTKSLYSKPDVFYSQMSYWLGRGLLALNGEDYKRHRKIIGPAWRKSVVDSHLPQVITLTNQFMEKLREVANGEDVDVRPLVRDHMGFMAATLFSDGHFPLSRMQPIFIMPETALVEIQLESINPVYYYLWHRFKKSTRKLEEKIYAAKAESTQIYADEKILAVERLKTNMEKKPTCPLDLMMLEYANREKDDKIDKEGLAEVLTILSASLDTSSFILNMCLLLIALHPEVQKRIFEEIHSVFGGSLRPVEHEDLSQLNYLEMAIKETLRMFPAAPIIARKAEEEVNISGVTVPKGCTVLINILALHRNPDIYKDPLVYDPSRFSREMSENRNSYAFVPFSAGFRNCPGQLQAFLMLKTTLCYVFREFEILPGTGIKSIDDIRPSMHFTFHLHKFLLRFVKRNYIVA